MLNLGSSFIKAPKSIVNYYSAGGTHNTNNATSILTFKTTLSGELTATTYKEILSVSGSGVIDIALAYAVDATSRTIGLKVVIDGTTVFDAVTDALTGTGWNIMAIGVYGAAVAHISPEPMIFKSSLSVSVKSSLNETDKVGLMVNYQTT